MKKYTSLYFTLLKLNFITLLAYRANFINSAVSSIGWGIISIVSMYILTAKTSSVYGWSRNELLLLTGVYSVSIGIFHTIFSRNFDRFSKVIHLGDLDGILLKPIDSQFLLSFTLFNYMSITRLLIGIIFTIYMLVVIHIGITLLSLVGFLIFILLGVLLLYSVWFGLMTLVLWATNLDNFKEFLYQLNNLGRYPSELLYHTGNTFLFLFIPITYIATIPVKSILLKPNIIDITIFIIASITLFFFSRIFWKFALRYYTSANR